MRPFERIPRPRPDLNAWLLVELAVPLDEACPERVHDHRGCLVEAAPRLIHAQAEGGKLATGEAAAHTEPKLAFAQHVSTAAFSATRSGSCQGRMTAAVPKLMPGHIPAR